MELLTDKPIILISNSESERNSFVTNLISLFNRSVVSTNQPEFLKDYQIEDSIILWDIESSFAKSNLDERFLTAGNMVINVDPDGVNESLFVSQGFRGVVYTNDTADLILKAIDWVARGDLWFKRKTLSDIAERHLRNQNVVERSICKATLSLFEKLTRKEKLIIQRIVDGFKNKEIASEFSISEHTVKSHVYSIYRKINARNRAQAINLGREFLPLVS